MTGSSFYLAEAPDPPQHVFAPVTPTHMLDKLWWEIKNLKQDLRRAPFQLHGGMNIAYSAFNSVGTAIPCSVWVCR